MTLLVQRSLLDLFATDRLVQAIGNWSEAEQELNGCFKTSKSNLAKSLLDYVPLAMKGDAPKWRWVKSGNRLFVDTSTDAAEP